jgi:myo-inositol-1-phosphate synthase
VPQQPRTGAWLVGARGSVATTTILGAAALRAGLAGPSGLVTELPDFAPAGLVPVDDLVFGGHDPSPSSLLKRAENLVAGGVVPAQLVASLHDELVTVDREVRPGIAAGPAGRPDRAVIDELAGDIGEFRDRHRLDRVVVVNVASTEAPVQERAEHRSWAELSRALDAGSRDLLPASSLYAVAAIEAGCAYADFTPSPGGRLPAVQQLAYERGLPYAGSDAKTGETLVKSVLAPMFAMRALRVRSWAGLNLLGGGDGATLADAEVAQSKLTSKSQALTAVLGGGVTAPMHIDYVPNLGDWKTAWDHISFEGFLGVPMTLQFTWQGCDSALAAPLVLDLVRLLARAHEIGKFGALEELSFFFKDPVGTDEHRLSAQWEALRRLAADFSEPAPVSEAG